MMLPRLKIGRRTDNLQGACIRESDRYTGLLLVGKPGTGKSTFLASSFEQDCLIKNSKIVIEPSGFLSRDCLSIARGRVKYLALENPISINPMQQPYNPNQIVDNIIESIDQIVRQSTDGANNAMTAKMRGIISQSIKWCLERNRKSLLHVRDHVASLKGDNETRDGIIQRLTLLLSDERLLPIICGNNAIEWGDFIQKGESLIVDCSGMSMDKMRFMGAIISHGLKSFFRYEKRKEYRPCVLYVDECQNFVNENWLEILKEGRKYKLATVLATQDFAVINERMVRVMLNVGSILAFRSGHREASMIAREVGVPAEVIQNLEKYHVVFKTPSETGIAKMPRPPIFKEMKLTPIKPQPVKTGGWFDLEPIQTEA